MLYRVTLQPMTNVRRNHRCCILMVGFVLVLPFLWACGLSTGYGPSIPATIEYRFDEREWSFEEISNLSKAEWTRTSAKAPSFGLRKDTLWIRVIPWVDGAGRSESSEGAKPSGRSESGERAEAAVLDVSYSQLDSVEVLYRSADGTVQRKSAGDLRPFPAREILTNTFAFDISEARGPVFVRIRSSGTLMAPVSLYSLEAWGQKLQIRNGIYGLFFGGLLLMILYNLFLYVSIRDRTYLYYSGYVSLVFLSLFSFLGYSHQFLWPLSNQWSNHSFAVLAMLYIAAGLQFTLRYLDIPGFSRAVYWSMRGLQGILIVASIAAVSGFYHIGTRIGLPVNILSSFLILYAAIRRARSDFRPARPFLIAWSFFLAGQIIASLALIGAFSDNEWPLHAPFIGSALELTLLSLALGDRFKHQQEMAVKDQLELTDSYSRFVPGEFLNFLNRKSIKEVHLGDSVRARMTVMFADIQSFTTLSESMTAEENFRFINALLRRIGPVIRKHNGFIDKYIGDAIMALFPKRGEDALEAILEMQELLAQYNHRREQKGLEPIRIGFGVHTGMVMLGTVGENRRMEGTVIGDTVNTASRLEGLTRRYGVSAIVSKDCCDTLKNRERYHFESLDAVEVKGKTKQVHIYDFRGRGNAENP